MRKRRNATITVYHHLGYQLEGSVTDTGPVACPSYRVPGCLLRAGQGTDLVAAARLCPSKQTGLTPGIVYDLLQLPPSFFLIWSVFEVNVGDSFSYQDACEFLPHLWLGDDGEEGNG